MNKKLVIANIVISVLVVIVALLVAKDFYQIHFQFDKNLIGLSSYKLQAGLGIDKIGGFFTYNW
jgi:hypothetical protein